MTALQVATDWVNRFPEAKVFPAYVIDGELKPAPKPQQGYPLTHKAWANADMALCRCDRDFAVLDVDNPEVAKKYGFTLNQLRDNGALIVKTASGGFHAYFDAEGKAYKKVLADKDIYGFDFWSVGQSVFLPGTKRPAYKGKSAGEYKIFHDVEELSPVPDWILEVVASVKPSEGGRHDKILEQIRTNYDNGLTKAESWKQLTEELIPTFNKDRDWIDEAKRALVGWYERDGNTDDRLRKRETPDGEYRLGRNNNRGVEILKGDTFIGWTGWFLTRRNWEYKEGYDEYVEFYRNATSYDLPELIIISPKGRKEYLDTLPPAVVVPPDVSLGGVGETTLFFGKTNQGKSWVGLWCAMMSGLPTLYIATEQVDDIALRAEMMNADNIYVVSQPSNDDIPKLSKLINDEGIGLVVLDVLSPMMIDENTTAEFHRVMDMLSSLTRERRFVIIHHSGKDDERGARGTSRIGDMVNRSYKISIVHENGISDIKIKPEKHKGLEGGEGGRLEVIRTDDKVTITPMDMDEVVIKVNHDTRWWSDLLEAWRIREDNQPLSHTKLWRLLKDVTEITEKAARKVIDGWVREERLEPSGKTRGGGTGYLPGEIKVMRK